MLDAEPNMEIRVIPDKVCVYSTTNYDGIYKFSGNWKSESCSITVQENLVDFLADVPLQYHLFRRNPTPKTRLMVVSVQLFYLDGGIPPYEMQVDVQ